MDEYIEYFINEDSIRILETDDKRFQFGKDLGRYPQ